MRPVAASAFQQTMTNRAGEMTPSRAEGIDPGRVLRLGPSPLPSLYTAIKVFAIRILSSKAIMVIPELTSCLFVTSAF